MNQRREDRRMYWHFRVDVENEVDGDDDAYGYDDDEEHRQRRLLL